MASCSSKPLTDLSRHSPAFLPAGSAPSPSAPSFRGRASAVEFKGKGVGQEEDTVQRDWERFKTSTLDQLPARFPTSQIEATTMTENIKRWKLRDEAEGEDVGRGAWSPSDLERVYGKASRSSTPSTPSQPSADEAYGQLSAPTLSSSAPPSIASPSIDPSTTLIGKSASAPHPLTYQGPLHAAWDYSRLFTQRRKWFGGIRLGVEELDAAAPLGIAPSPTAPPSVRPTSHSSARQEDPAADEERQRLQFVKLSGAAKRRLALIGQHLG